jgi:hypothetical protein
MTDKEKDGRLVAVSSINVEGVSYQKGEYVETAGLPKEELDFYVEQGVLWTESQWVGKYKEKPVDHVEPKRFPPVAGTSTTAQAAAAVQTAQPALRREGDQRVETTTSGQAPDERKTAATPPGAVARPATSTPTVKSDGQKK